MGIFRKKLDAKEILFPLQKDLVSSVYELRKTTLDDSRRPRGLDSKPRVGEAYREAGALVFFLIFSPIKLSNLPSSVEMLLVGVLKAWAMTMTTGFEKKDEKQKFIENAIDDKPLLLSWTSALSALETLERLGVCVQFVLARCARIIRHTVLYVI